MPGTKQETAGVIRFGATLVHAFAEATVPRLTVIVRKAFGGAFITMNSKDLGADYVFAWPQAEIGVMGAKPAVGIIHRRELAAADDPEQARERLAAEYADSHLRPEVAAREGYIDELISPAETRERLVGAFATLGARRMSGELLLTGATGFVGMEVLGRYLESSDRQIITPVRADDDRAASERIRGTLRELFGIRARRYEPRVEAVAADLTQPYLGLRPRRRDEIASRVEQIIHSAASVSFSLPLEESRAINLEGTRRMLELAELAQARGGLTRYAHVSTAYIAGDHCGRFHEHDHDVAQAFRNAYEQSKFEAEWLVRARPDLPATILRPSIVVGDRRSGWTAAFNVLYWPLRAFARGLYPAVPAEPDAPVDVVSIDYVADAIYALCQSDTGIGRTYHVTAGRHASTVGELVEAASRYFKRPPPRLLSPHEFADYAKSLTGVQRATLGHSAAYFPYFACSTEFDNCQARARLEPDGIDASALTSYIERLLDYAILTRWGKRPVSRIEALAT